MDFLLQRCTADGVQRFRSLDHFGPQQPLTTIVIPIGWFDGNSETGSKVWSFAVGLCKLQAAFLALQQAAKLLICPTFPQQPHKFQLLTYSRLDPTLRQLVGVR
jgi:hypothetical protein